ncbi:MAG: hypothetical protein PVG78_00620 [Desulfobacterales bacterium]|jgi:hypothetical protein
MNRQYPDSLFPFGIGASFVATLLVLLLGGALAGLVFEPFLARKGFEQGGGILLLVIVLVILVGPIFYNRRMSRFERGRTPLVVIDYLGIIQGLRGAFIRLLLYDEGLEIRAFYHRYYIPFDKIDAVSIERIRIGKRLAIKTPIPGAPKYLTVPEKDLLDLTREIQDKISANKACSADANDGVADDAACRKGELR